MNEIHTDEAAKTDMLINSVKKCPVLFDSSHPDYRNFAKRMEGWQEVAQECQMDINQARRKWQDLCSRFRTILQQEKVSKLRKRIKWSHRKKMEFFESFLNKAPIQVDSSSDLDNIIQESNYNINETVEKYFKRKAEKKRKRRETESVDTLGHFFRSMEGMVRRFSESSQLQVKSALSDLVLKLEAKRIQEEMRQFPPQYNNNPGPSNNAFLNHPNNRNVPYPMHPDNTTQPDFRNPNIAAFLRQQQMLQQRQQQQRRSGYFESTRLELIPESDTD